MLAGKVAVVEAYGTPDQRVLRVHGPGRFLDELGLVTGQPSFVTYLACEPGEVLAVPLDGLRRLVAQAPHVGDFILSAFLIRREMLIDAGVGLQIIGSRYSPDSPAAARVRRPQPAARTGGSTWRPDPAGGGTTAAGSGSGRRRPRWSSGAARRCCAIPAARNWPRLTGFDPPGPAGAVCDLAGHRRGAGRPGRRGVRRLGRA